MRSGVGTGVTDEFLWKSLGMNTRPAQSLRTLLVEDHDTTRLTIRKTLELDPRVQLVAEAQTGADGLSYIRQLQPDLAILNIGLPDMDGIELTKLAKGHCPLMRVLILTGSDREESVLAAFAAGADGYCRKDVTADNLLKALEQMRTGNSWIDPAIAHVVLDRLRSAESGDLDTVTIAAADAELAEMLEVSPLTNRELEVLEKIVHGYTNAAIAEEFEIGMGTVKTHVRNLLHKLSASDRTQAAVRALRAGLVK